MEKQRTATLGKWVYLPVLLLAVLLWAAAGAALWVVSQAELDRSLTYAGSEVTASLSALVPTSATTGGRTLTETERSALWARTETLGLSGAWIYHLENEKAAPLFRFGAVPQALQGLLDTAAAGASCWILAEDGAGGRLLLSVRPLTGFRGTVMGCVAVALDVTEQVNALRENILAAILALTALAAVLTVIVLWFLRRNVSAPLGQLTAAAASCATGENPAVFQALAAPGGPFATLAACLGTVAGDMEAQLLRTREKAAAEAKEATQMGLAAEINDSVLPQCLPETPNRANFEVLGRVEQGNEVNAYLYDYFFIDPGLLCVAIGDVPGHGVPASLFMVVAQTTIRSRLRMGRSLAETMADVNRQLHDLENQLCLNALVGTLNVADGRFSYVNAGQRRPLLMRNEDRYEWLESPVYAPLGMNENVSYRLEELRLKQGDRLFFYTAGMADIADRAGTPFGEGRLQVSLNLSRSRELALEELLRFASEEAQAYSEAPRLRDGFALMALEYRKGEKDLAHCDVPNQPEYAGEVSAFLNRQFQENGITRRYYARTAVLVDEMFALCCRWAVRADMVMVECGIAPDAQMVTIRMTAVLGGVDPLSHTESGVAGDAADFIRGSADFVTFKPGEDRDTITMVSYLGE